MKSAHRDALLFCTLFVICPSVKASCDTTFFERIFAEAKECQSTGKETGVVELDRTYNSSIMSDQMYRTMHQAIPLDPVEITYQQYPNDNLNISVTEKDGKTSITPDLGRPVPGYFRMRYR